MRSSIVLTVVWSERDLGNIHVWFAFLIFQPILGVKAMHLNRESGKVNLCMIKGYMDF